MEIIVQKDQLELQLHQRSVIYWNNNNNTNLTQIAIFFYFDHAACLVGTSQIAVEYNSYNDKMKVAAIHCPPNDDNGDIYRL